MSLIFFVLKLVKLEYLFMSSWCWVELSSDLVASPLFVRVYAKNIKTIK